MNNWQYHDKKMIELKKLYIKISKQTQNRLQEIFDSIDFDFNNLYNVADNNKKNRINIYIEECKDKGLLTGYFGMLAYNIYKRTRVKNSEILELLIYGAYIEEQNKLEEKELNIFKDDINYYYQQGQEEVNNILPKNKKKKVSVIPDAIFLAFLDKPNSKGYVYRDYIQSILKYDADQIYRQVIIDIQQQKPLKTNSDIYQSIINRQQNQKLNINGDRISGDVDLTLIGLNNIAKSEGIYSFDKNATVKFIAIEDKVTTKMCHSLNNQIFKVHDWNEFYRYSETNGSTTKYRCYGLIQGLNLPPVNDHFHWCRSTIEYIKVENQTQEEYNINNPNYIRNNNFTSNEDLNKNIFEALNILPKHIQELLKDTKFQIILSNSCYDRKKDIIYLLEDSNKYEVLHEIGHVIETKNNILNNDKYIEIRKIGLENSSIYGTYHLRGYNRNDLIGLKSKKFISEYQSLLYAKDFKGKSYITSNGMNLNCLGEYFSEGFREYFQNNKNLMQKDVNLYNYIKELLHNG